MQMIFGDVRDVVEGRVQKLQDIPLEKVRFGLGSGSFSDIHSIGETIVLEGRPFVSWVEKGKVITETRQHLQSPFLLTIGHAPPKEILYLQPDSPFSLQSLYERLTPQYSEGFSIVGYGLFAEFHSSYLKTPPIFNENINTHRTKYWAKVSIETEASACFFGTVSLQEEKRAFYHNPGEAEASALMSHTHGALLSAPFVRFPKEKDFPQMLKNVSVVAVRHLLTQSIIREGLFAIFS